MNFPMEDPIFRFIYWLLNTAGIGGISVLLLIGGLVSTFALVLRWVTRGAQADEPEQYAFPTPTLVKHERKDD